MSKTHDTQETLEVKIRPYSNQNNQERPDQKGVSRVHMCKEALMDLGLQPGQAIFLWKNNENINSRREAIAWLTAEKNLSKKVVQIAKSFQEICGFKLADDLIIGSAGNVNVAESIVLRDTTEGLESVELRNEDKPHWEWFIRENLGRAEVVFSGMTFKGISLRGPKRNFTIISVNGTAGQGRFAEQSIVTIVGQHSDPAELSQMNGISHRLEVTNIAGIDNALSKLNGFLSNFNREFKFTKAKRSCAILIHGGRGTGKTLILDKIAASGWGKVHKIDSDAKVATIRTTFKDATLSQPSIILIDEFEDLVSKDDSTSRDNARALAMELDCLMKDHSPKSLPQVLVVAAAREPSNIPNSLRKIYRFETEVALPVPDTAARKSILKSLAPSLHPEVKDDVIEKIGDRTHAYTAEDLEKLLNAAYELAERRLERVETALDSDYYLEQEDLEGASAMVRPTAMHDVTLKPPSVRWNQIGGQDNVKKALRRAVEIPLLHPERVKRVGVSAKKGLLLYGPPGCSKTLSAQAMATEIGFNFFAVKGAELLNMYVGESERAVRDIFNRARAASPSIIFFDEIESIGSKREGRNNGVNVLTTLLNEMDGIEALKGVTVLAATNQPQALDLALLRPGRFDKLLYVAPPDLSGREEILRVREQIMDLADDVNIPELARLTEGYSGAELVGICQTAGDDVLEKCETEGKELQVQMKDFLNAIKLVKKQITTELLDGYEQWATGARGSTE